jgi:Ca2+/Na+ antiporter
MLLLAILFVLLSPGVLLTIPAGSKGLFMSRQTSIASAIVHSIVFVLVLRLIKKCYMHMEHFKVVGTNTQGSATVTQQPVRQQSTQKLKKKLI